MKSWTNCKNIENALARYTNYGNSIKPIERSIKINVAGNFIKALAG
jgi:hypothetical protein